MHLVYYFFHPVTEDLIYIGRTCNLPERIKYFSKRTGLTPLLGVCQRHRDLEVACSAELAAIRKHQPTLNRREISSSGSFGKHFTLSEDTKRRMSQSAKGKPKAAEHREHMKKPKSPEHRAKLALALQKARAARRWGQR